MRAVERATDERLPLLASPTSGGTRMQEGTVAFLQMVKISAAFGRHKAAGNPYLVYLRNPTTGGVLASWGSLGHVTVAEPGALIGFLGPRVYEALYGEHVPGRACRPPRTSTSTALVDAVVPPDADRRSSATGRSTCWPRPARARRTSPRCRCDELPDIPAWESITRSRNARPARGAAAAAARRPRRRPAARHRRGRERAGPAARAGALRRSALRRARPGPQAPDDGQAARPGRAARGPARDEARRRARAAARHRDRHRRAPPCPRRPRRAGWPARSPARWPTWSCSTRRPSACCSARAPAEARWRCCPPTG